MATEYTEEQLWKAIEFVVPAFKEVRDLGVQLSITQCLDLSIISLAHMRWKRKVENSTWDEPSCFNILHQAYDDLHARSKFNFNEVEQMLFNICSTSIY